MKPYNLKNLSDGLQEQASQISANDILKISAAEELSPTTVRKYLKGEIAHPAIGQAILNRCREIQKQQKVA